MAGSQYDYLKLLAVFPHRFGFVERTHYSVVDALRYHLQATYMVTITFNNFVGRLWYPLTYPSKSTIRPVSWDMIIINTTFKMCPAIQIHMSTFYSKELCRFKLMLICQYNVNTFLQQESYIWNWNVPNDRLGKGRKVIYGTISIGYPHT